MKNALFGSMVIAIVFSGSGAISSVEAPDAARSPCGVSTARTIPPQADNRTKFLRAAFEHLGHPCFAAAGISYVFTYEVNLARNVPSNTDKNLYPYTYAYFFHNNGNTMESVADVLLAYQLLLATGVPNNTAMGGFEAGFYTATWLNGYEKYYQAMYNRIQGYGVFDLKTANGFTELKQWLYDHGTGATNGGLANINVGAIGVEIDKISSGAEAGKTIITSFGTHYYNHTLTVVGYNDNVNYDLNHDQTVSDDEKGAFLVLNSHIVWDSGFAYCPYKLFKTPYTQGGIGRGDSVFYIKVLKEYQPKYTLKTTITHPSRGSIKIYAGIAPDSGAAKPAKVKNFAGAFNYAGGAYPMEGKGQSATIEIGLDVTDLVDSIGGKAGAFFLCIDSKTGGGGMVKKLSLMDYTHGTPKETVYKGQDIPITGTLQLGGIVSGTAAMPQGYPFTISGMPGKPNLIIRGGNITVAVPGTDLYGAHIGVYSIRGDIVLRKTECRSPASCTDLATSSLAAGIYQIVITPPGSSNAVKRCAATVTIIK